MTEPIGESQTYKFNHKINLFHEYYESHNRRIRDRCTVDILIPFHGNYTGVRKLVKSILENTHTNPYQITLIDDASPNAKFTEILMQAPQTKCIRLKEQKGFAGALKVGLEATEQPFVCILHSDCQVLVPKWLEELGSALFDMHSKGVRLVSGRTNNPLSDIPELMGKRGQPIANMVSDLPLPLYCALCERSLFNEIGFLKEYPYAGFEDEEFYWRMKKYGFKQGIAGRVWVEHEGEATIKELIKKRPQIIEEMNENRNRCLKDIKSLQL